MKTSRRSLTLLTLFLCANASHAQQNLPDLNTEDRNAVVSFATFEIYKDKAFRLATNVADPSQLKNKIEAHMDAFYSRVMESQDDSTGRSGSALLLQTYSQLSPDTVKLKELARKLIKRFYSLSCSNYFECVSYIKDLSDLATVVPAEIRFQIDALRSSQVVLTETQAKLLHFRIESLDALDTYYSKSNFSSLGRGRTPRMVPADITALKAQLAALERSREEIKNLSTFSIPATASAGEQQLIQALMQDERSSLDRLAMANASLALYLERLNLTDIGPWLKSVEERVLNGQLDASTAFFALTRFAQVESYLPWRAEWAELATDMAERLPSQLASFKGAAQALSDLARTRRTELEAWLKAVGLDVHMNSLGSETYAERILDQEKTLAIQFPLYESAFYQVQGLQAARLNLAEAAQTFDKGAQSLGADQANYLFQSAQDDAVGPLMINICYARSLSTNAALLNNEFKVDWLTSFFGDPSEKSLFLNGICGAPSLASGRTGLETRVWNEIQKRRSSKIVWGSGIRIGVESAFTIPVVMMSFGTGEVVAKAASVAVTEWGTAYAVRIGANKIATWALTKALPYAAYGMSGAATFTVMKRVGYAVTTVKPIYDPKLSLYDNYGLDVLFGSVGFFFLPYYEGVAKFIELVQKTPAIASNMTLMQSTYYFFGSSIECMLFASLPVVNRAIRNHITGTNDPIIKDAGDAGLIYVQALNFTLGYKIIWSRFGPWLSRRFPVMMDPRGTSGVVPTQPYLKWLQPAGAAAASH